MTATTRKKRNGMFLTLVPRRGDCRRILDSRFQSAGLLTHQTNPADVFLRVAMVEENGHRLIEKRPSDGGAELPVRHLRDLLVDVRQHDDDLPAAHQHRHGVGTDGDGEDERAGEDAGHREEGDREEGPPAAGAETPGRLFQRRVDPWMMPIRERIMKGRLS